MKKALPYVMLSAAKDLALVASSQWEPQILRGAQDDIWSQVFNSMALASLCYKNHTRAFSFIRPEVVIAIYIFHVEPRLFQ